LILLLCEIDLPTIFGKGCHLTGVSDSIQGNLVDSMADQNLKFLVVSSWSFVLL
jgi:hypothetical protein